MRLIRFTFPLTTAALLASGAHANLLTNGDFESQPNFGINGDGSYTLLTGSQLPGWTIEPGHGVTIHNHGYPYISGKYSVNMDGEGFNGHNADFYQDFGSGLGTSYLLSFDWAIWQNSSNAQLAVTVTDTVTSSVLASGIYNAASGTFSETKGFVGTGNALRLRVFESPESTYNDNRFIVDNFSVQAVPEPATLAALGLAAMGLARRRRG